MTRTHHLTHSALFQRLLARTRVRSEIDGDAREFLERRELAEDAFLELFDSFDDFDALVHECIPVLEPELPVEAGRRERNVATRAHGSRGHTASRSRPRQAAPTVHVAAGSRR